MRFNFLYSNLFVYYMDSVIFYLNIYEINGKNTVNLYVDDVKRRLDLLKIKYEVKSKDEVVSAEPSISEMDGKDESIISSLLSSVGESTTEAAVAVNQKDEGLVSLELFVHDDSLEKTKYLGVQQLNSWLLSREKEQINLPIV